MSWPEVNGVTMHSDGFGPSTPAINVKVYDWRGFDEAKAELMKAGASEAVAEEAVDIAREMNAELFWEQAKETAKFYLCTNRHTERMAWYGFSPGLKVYGEGRSGGWLVVHGLPHPEEWNKAQRIRWERFANAIRADVDYLCSAECILDLLDANDTIAHLNRRNAIAAKVDAYRAELEASM